MKLKRLLEDIRLYILWLAISLRIGATYILLGAVVFLRLLCENIYLLAVCIGVFMTIFMLFVIVFSGLVRSF